MSQILIFNKPFQVLCQFSDKSSTKKRQTLANFIKIPNFYAAGRLDFDSEGLLILTNNGKLQNQISNPDFKLPKTYLVQVEGKISKQELANLTKGVELKDGISKPAKVKMSKQPQWLWARNPPIRKRKNIPTSWIEITISEGKNRQIRRMTAAVGYPTLRLVRIKIGKWTLNKLQPGEYIEHTCP